LKHNNNNNNNNYNNNNNFRSYSKEITLHSCIQYSGLIALSKVFLLPLPLNAHSTDSGLDHSTPQSHFSNTRSTLFGSAVTPFTAPSTLATLSTTTCQRRNSRCYTTVSLLLSVGHICHLCASQISNPIPVTRSRSEWLSRSLSRRCWLVASLVVWRQRLRRSPRY